MNRFAYIVFLDVCHSSCRLRPRSMVWVLFGLFGLSSVCYDCALSYWILLFGNLIFNVGHMCSSYTGYYVLCCMHMSCSYAIDPLRVCLRGCSCGCGLCGHIARTAGYRLPFNHSCTSGCSVQFQGRIGYIVCVCSR